MNFTQATAALRKVGAAHATGDALAAMYADLCASQMRGAKPELFYADIRACDDMGARVKELLTDPWAYTDVLMSG